jgi:hypothetical protein
VQLLEALRYKPEGRGFDSRWCHWNFSIDLIQPTQPLTEMSTRNISWGKGGRCAAVMKSGSFNLLEQSGLSRSLMGVALRFYYGRFKWFFRVKYVLEIKVKVKVTLVQALRLCTDRTAHRGSRGIALLFHDHGTRRRWGVSVTPRPLFTPGKDPVPIVQEAGWAPGPVWTGAKNFAPTGVRSSDLPAGSQSLYWLS